MSLAEPPNDIRATEAVTRLDGPNRHFLRQMLSPASADRRLPELGSRAARREYVLLYRGVHNPEAMSIHRAGMRRVLLRIMPISLWATPLYNDPRAAVRWVSNGIQNVPQQISGRLFVRE